MSDTRTYYVGEAIRAVVESGHGDKVKFLTALFAHESDPNRIIRLVGGSPAQREMFIGGGQIAYTWQSVLAGKAGPNERPGTYGCVSLIARYTDGTTAGFDRLPEHTFTIARRDRPNASVKTWSWG